MKDQDRNISAADACSSQQIQEGFMNIARFKTLPSKPISLPPNQTASPSRGFVISYFNYLNKEK